MSRLTTSDINQHMAEIKRVWRPSAYELRAFAERFAKTFGDVSNIAYVNTYLKLWG